MIVRFVKCRVCGEVMELVYNYGTIKENICLKCKVEKNLKEYDGRIKNV